MTEDKSLSYLIKTLGINKDKKIDIKFPEGFSLPEEYKVPIQRPKRYVDSKPVRKTNTKVNNIKKGRGRIY